MARGDKARAQLEKYKQRSRAALKRAKEAAMDQRNQDTVAAVAGGAAAGALRGYGAEIALGDFDVGWGLLAGAALAVYGDQLMPSGRALGAGMLAGEAYALTAEITMGMLEAPEEAP